MAFFFGIESTHRCRSRLAVLAAHTVEAVVLDGGGEYTMFFKIYLLLNWRITTALAIITFISTWNAFLWPFLVVTTEPMMTIPVGITQVNELFGIAYARIMSAALFTAMPVAFAYLVFQRRVTETISQEHSATHRF